MEIWGKMMVCIASVIVLVQPPTHWIIFFVLGVNDIMYKMTIVPTRNASEQAVGSLLTFYSGRKYASGNDITEAVAEVLH